MKLHRRLTEEEELAQRAKADQEITIDITEITKLYPDDALQWWSDDTPTWTATFNANFIRDWNGMDNQ